MRIITFREYSGVDVTIRADLIERVVKPSGRVHDHGGVMLTSGRWISFGSDSTADQVIKEMQEEVR